MPIYIILLVVGTALALAWRQYRSYKVNSYENAMERLEPQATKALGSATLHSLRVIQAGDANWRTLLLGGHPALAALQGKTLRVVWIGAGNRIEQREIALSESELVIERPGELSYGVPIVLRLTTTFGALVMHAADEDGDADNAQSNTLFEQLSPLVRHAKRSAAGPLSNAVKLALLAPLLLATIALVRISSDRPLAGPMTVAVSSSGQIAAAGERMLYIIDGPDSAVREFDLADLGVTGLVTHMAYSPEGELHLADSSAGSIFACDAAFNECGFLSGMSEIGGPFGDSFKFAFSPDGQHIVVADTYRNSLVVVARDGDVVSRHPQSAVGLCLPNGIAFGRDGHLYVANSNYLRIAEYTFVDGKIQTVNGHPTYAAGTGDKLPRCIDRAGKLSDLLVSAPTLPGMRTDRVRPVAIAQLDDGSWWVTLSNDRTDAADVAIFDAQWANPRRVALPEDGDSFALAALGSSMLIADTQSPGLYRGESAGATAKALPHAKFTQLMEGIASDRLIWNLGRGLAILVMILATLGALAFGIKRGQQALHRLTT